MGKVIKIICHYPSSSLWPIPKQKPNDHMSIFVKASYTETSENDLKQKWWRSEESRWKKLINDKIVMLIYCHKIVINEKNINAHQEILVLEINNYQSF